MRQPGKRLEVWNGKPAKPGSMTEYIAQEGLPLEEIARIQTVPAQLIAFQAAFAAGESDQPLWQFLVDNFPEMYGSERLVQIELKQPTLFGPHDERREAQKVKIRPEVSR